MTTLLYWGSIVCWEVYLMLVTYWLWLSKTYLWYCHLLITYMYRHCVKLFSYTLVIQQTALSTASLHFPTTHHFPAFYSMFWPHWRTFQFLKFSTSDLRDFARAVSSAHVPALLSPSLRAELSPTTALPVSSPPTTASSCHAPAGCSLPCHQV